MNNGYYSKTSVRRLHALLLLSLLLVSVVAPFVPIVFARVGTTTSNQALEQSMQRKSFYAAGRYWIFYSDDGVNFGYKSSTDGATWVSFTEIDDGFILGPERFSITFDGTYIHYVRLEDTPYELKYRMGTPQAAGTITWAAVEQTVIDTGSHSMTGPVISTDADGLPWVGYWLFQSGEHRAQVILSSTKDGTWSTNASTPYNLTSTSSSRVVPVPLTGGDMYFVWADGTWNGDITAKGRLWNATLNSWGAEQTVVASLVHNNKAFSAVSNTTHVFIGILQKTTETINVYVWDATWDSNPYTAKSYTTETSYPVLTYDSTGDSVYIFWIGSPLANHIYYNIFNITSSTMSSSGWTDWLTETDGVAGNNMLSAFYMDYNSEVGMFYLSESSPPYDIEFHVIGTTFVPPPASWLTGFTYRKSIETENATGAGTGYQVQVVIHSGSGVDYIDNSTSPPEAHIYVNGKARGDAGDIRFTGSDGTTELDYLLYDVSGTYPADDAIYLGTYINMYPLGYYYNGLTYYVYHGPSSDPYVAYYNHSSGNFSTAVKAGTNPLTNDGHGHPIVVRDDDGYLHVFFGSHSSNLKHSKSDNPDDITAWSAQGDPASSTTYPSAIRTGTDTFYLFYRKTIGANENEDIVFLKTTDNFASFGAETTIVDMDNYITYPNYFAFDSTNDLIHLTWFRYTYNVKHENGYHGYLNLTDGNMYSMDGTNLGATVTNAEADANCKFLTYSDQAFFSRQPFSALHLNDSLIPYILWFNGTFNFIKWDGGAWTSPVTIDSGPNANGDFIIDGDNVTAYLVDDNTDLSEYISTDSGDSWDSGTIVLSKMSPGQFWTPRIVKDYHNDFKVRIGNYIADYSTGLAVRGYGDSGEVLSDSTTIFFVEVRDNLNTVNRTIYVYYGASGSSTTSDGEGTFPWLFDDFNDYSVGDIPNAVDWIRDGIAVGGNNVTVQADPGDSSVNVFKIEESADGTNTLLQGVFKGYRSGFALHYRWRTAHDIDGQYFAFFEDATYIVAVKRDDVTDRFEWYDGGGYVDFTPQWTASINTWYEIMAELGPSYSHFISGTEYTGGIWNAPAVGVNITQWLLSGTGFAMDNYIGGLGENSRYIFVRKFVKLEPEFVNVGSEEEDVNVAPTVGSFTSSESSVNPDEYFYIGVDSGDTESNLTTVDMSVGTDLYSVTFSYNNNTGVHSILSDPSGIATLDTGSSSMTILNATAIRVSWTVKFTAGFGDGYKDASCTATDGDSDTGEGTSEDLFYFYSDATVTFGSPLYSTTLIGAECNLTIRVQSTGQELYGFYFEHNASGTPVNETFVDTLTGFDDYAEIEITLPGTSGQIVGFRWFVQAIDESWHTSSSFSLTTSTSGETGIVTLTTFSNPVAFTFQRKSHWGDRFWVFYSNNINMVWKTSEDGVTWSTSQTIGTAIGGYIYSFWFDEDNSRVHYVYNTNPGDPANEIRYRAGITQADGNIDWVAGEQVVYTANATNYLYTPTIALDSSGNPWVGFTMEAPDSTVPVVTASSRSDGIWQTEAGFPYQLSDVSSGPYAPRVMVVPLTGGDTYTIYGYQSIGWNGTFYDYSGSSWDTTENITGTWGAMSGTSVSSTGIGDEVYFGFFRSTGTMYLFNRTAGSWANRTITTGLSSTASPIVSRASTSILIFWKNNDHIWYRTYRPDTDTLSDTSDLVNEELDTLITGADISSFYKSYGGYLGVVYLTAINGISPPYRLKLAYLTFIPAGLTSFDVTDSVGDDWIFVEEVYTYRIIFDSNMKVEFRFSDGSTTVVVDYDVENDVAIVTSGSSIAAILRWTYTSSTDTLDVSMVLNVDTRDAYGVDVDARATSTVETTGWTELATNAFNIYSIGGLNFIETSGWAGIGSEYGEDWADSGYSPWDIFAADTRTLNILPKEDFNVRSTPLSPGVVAFGTVYGREDEGKLLRFLDDWVVHIPSREVNHTIYPTNRLPDSAPPDATSYYNRSYPFGLRIIDSPRSLSRYMFIEKEFLRSISVGEIVTVSMWVMTPLTSGTTGRILISDVGLYPYFAEGGSARKAAVNFFWNGNGNFTIYDGGTPTVVSTYVGWQWYNITFVLNTSSLTFDAYKNDVLIADDFDFQDGPDAQDIGVITLAQNLYAPLGNYTDIYIDDVSAHTDWAGDYGGEARTSVVYKNLQSFQGIVGIGIEDPDGIDYPNQGHWEIAFDSLFEGSDTWTDDVIRLRLITTDSFSGMNTRYVEFNVSWYVGNTLKRSDIIYAFYEGYGEDGAEKDIVTLYIDLWYNRLNASSVVEGRVTAFYFGMEDTSIPYIKNILGRNWKEISDDVSSFSALPLMNGSDRKSARDVLLTRFSLEVLRSDNYQFHYRYRSVNPYLFAQTPGMMVGIDGVEVRTTTYPKLPQGGIGGAISGLVAYAMRVGSNAVSSILVMAGTALVQGIDWVFSFIFNQEGVFSMIIRTISIMTGNLGQWLLTTGGWIYRLVTDYASAAFGLISLGFKFVFQFLDAVTVPGTTVWGALVNTAYIINAWMTGITYTSPWGDVYNFSAMYGFQVWGYHGGYAVFALIGWLYIVMMPIRMGMALGAEGTRAMIRVVTEPISICYKVAKVMYWIMMAPLRAVKWIVELVGSVT